MNALKIRGLKKTYGGGTEALKGIDLTVEEGDFFALLGPNGAGKSTTIGVTASLVNKTEGSVEIFGHNVDQDLAASKALLGLVPQEVNFDQFNKVQNIVIEQAGFYGIPRKIAKQRTAHYLKQLGLWEKRKARARDLSGGMKRRLMIARALVSNPKLLILDEPTAGVDIELRRSMWDFLRKINKEGTTIILTTHYLEEAEQLCRNIAIIDRGQIVRHSSMQSLLNELKHEVLVLHLEDPLTDLPIFSGFKAELVEPQVLEVEVTADNNVNQLFDLLNKQGIRVANLRNKTNRLEELFLNLISTDDQVAA